MTDKTYKPQVSDLIDMSFIPGEFKQAEEAIEDFFGDLIKGVRYNEHLVFHSRENDAKIHTLNLLSVEKSEVEADRLPIRFVITAQDGIECIMEWQWPIKRYFPLFDINKIKQSTINLFDLAFDFIDFSDPKAILSDLAEAIIPLPLDVNSPEFDDLREEIEENSNFVTLATEVQAVVDELDAVVTANSGIKLGKIIRNLGQFQPLRAVVDDLIAAYRNQLEDPDAGIEIIFDIIRARLEGLSLQEAIDLARDVLYPYMGLAKWEDFEALLLPYIRVSLRDVSIVSEKWLKPVDQDGNIKQPANPGDPAPRSVLDFNIGHVKYDTRKGITFDDAIQGDLERSMIGNSGLVITLQKVKPDFSRSESIPEIRDAGYPDDFRGAYVKLARLELPQKWFHPPADSNSNLNTLPEVVGSPKVVMAIMGENMIFGSGDFSGVIRLQPVKAEKVN